MKDIVSAKCIKSKIVEIEGCNYEIQLVVPKGDKPEKYVGQSVNVEIAQISKIGKICQVKLIK